MTTTDKPRYLFLFDFDGTLADTFTKSPNGIGVNEAYEGGVVSIFGEAGAVAFRRIGGLQNRAPAELIRALLEVDPSLREVGKRFHDAAKHADVPWDEENPINTFTELLVREKLGILVKEIGTADSAGKQWPQPFPGVVEFFRIIDAINQRGEVQIDIGIISSGHTEFIRRTFEMWGVPLPPIFVTDDDIRGRQHPREAAHRVKPGLLPFAIAYLKWLDLRWPGRQQSEPHSREPIDSPHELKQYILYVGDDAVRDGGLAHGAHMEFCSFDPTGRAELQPGDARFSDWSQLHALLLEHEDQLRAGEPLARVIAPLVETPRERKFRTGEKG